MRRSVFRIFPLCFLLPCLLLLPGCAAEGLMSLLGFDMHNYLGEETLAVLDVNGETAQTLAEMTRVLTVNTPQLTPFEGADEAADACRDAILNDMLETHYAQYAGNTALLSDAAKAYPQMQISVLIPAEDFEATVYRMFGGSQKIANRSGELFRYLDKIDAYTTAANPQTNNITTTVTYCEETERTYRLYFVNSLDGVTSPEYFALMIKRDDGSLYFKLLEISSRGKF